ncbi:MULTISPECIES: response regulator [unclassified Pseudomonas]|uniref:response regulator n=1 Tax=unclassified Pseudomonas TaxID=196821 RepID=UPI001C4901D1|nr:MULTISPECIES: response regulator [unclassified Pseudomonas]
MAYRFSLTSRMTLLIFIMCTVLVGSDIWRSFTARSVQLGEVTIATANLARAMAQHADDTFKEADLVLSGVVERVQRDGTTPSALERLHQLFISRCSELSQLDGLYLFDRNGELLTSSLPGPLRSYNNADREYFIFHQTHPDLGVHISPPLRSRSTGKWTIPVSRRINNPDGSFAGIAGATIDIDFFSQFYNRLEIGQEGAVALEFDSGVMAIRRPFEERLIGADMTNTRLFQEHKLQPEGGTFSIASAQDGVVRLNTYRSLHDYPLFVAAALSKDENLASWWSDTLWHAAGVGLLTCLLVIFGLRLIRQVNLQSKTEKELAASLETTRAILETAANPIITIDGAGKIRSLNPAGQRAFGYSTEEIIGRNIRTLVPESHLAAYNAYTAEFSQQSFTETGSSMELAGLRKDGSTFPLYASTSSMKGSDERCFVCVMTDITEQKKHRSDLAATRDHLLLAADIAELGIWSWNLCDGTLHWNDRMFEIYGYSQELLEHELNFEHWRSRFHPDDLDIVIAALNAVIDDREQRLPSFRIVLTDGRVRHLETRVRVERDANGTPTLMTGINHDVTAQHEMEVSLRHAKEQADAASAAKSSFLANMSHEIRTPMNAVLGMLHLVQFTPLNLRQRDYVSKAQTAAQSLLGLLNDILDYSKIEAGKLQLDPHPFDFEPLMQDLGVVLAGNQGQKDIEVLFDIDPALPGGLIGDSLRLQQVLINLAGNALKFTLKGQVIVSLELLERRDSAVQVRIAVTDSGIGMSAEQIGHIFEGFNQAEASTSRRFGGSGLGLVICKRLVKLMGGDLLVESRPDVGSRFWFDVWLKVDTGATTRTGALPDNPSMRVLVVDDNPIAAELLMRTVATLGWQADLVSSGVEAVSRISDALHEGERYDVVLMDWRMPDLNGMSAAKLIRELKGRVPPPVVVMITAYGREVLAESHDRGDAPFAGFITKPVTPRQLTEVILRALRGIDAATETPAFEYKPSKRLEGLNFLVVEDNALNRQVIEELLKSEGASVQLAEGGFEGVNCVITGNKSFDAVLMDVQMPDIDGYEATRRIRTNPRFTTLPIIAITANASSSDRQACLQAGMNGHVGKPIDIEHLVSVLRAQLDGKEPPAPVATPTLDYPLTEQGELIEARASILERLDGNLNLIRNVLKIFGPDTEKQFANLDEQIAQKNWAGAASVLHAIKGSAGTIGALALSRRAAQIEQTLNTGAASTTINPLVHKYSTELRQLMRDCLEQLMMEFAEPTGPTEPAGETLPLTEWRIHLNEILTLLNASNLQAIAAAEALLSQTPAERLGRFNPFIKQVRALDFTAAALSAYEMLEQA